MAVVCTTAFFFHQNFISTPEPLTELYEIYHASKDKRTESLEVIKESAKNTEEYEVYLKHKLETNIAYDNLKIAIENNKVYGFNNKRIFFGELDWSVGLFLYAVFNLALSLFNKKETFLGEIIFHCNLIFIALFYVRYCFLDGNDYGNIEYYLINLFCVSLILIATHLLILGVKKEINKPLYDFVKWVTITVRGKYVKNIAYTALNDKENYNKTLDEIGGFEKEFKVEVAKAVNVSLEDFEKGKSNYSD